MTHSRCPHWSTPTWLLVIVWCVATACCGPFTALALQSKCRQPYRSTVLADAPLAMWALDDTSSATDLTGNGRTGAATGVLTQTAALTPRKDSKHGAFSVGITEGTGAFRIPAFEKFPGGATGYTIEFWIKVTSFAAGTGLMNVAGDGDSAGSYYAMAYINAATSQIRIYKNANFLDCGAALTIGTTYHVAITWGSDTGAVAGFIDGVSACTGNLGSGVPSNSANGFHIGNDLRESNNAYYAVDEVSFFSKPLSAARVLHHYENGKAARTCSVSTSQSLSLVKGKAVLLAGQSGVAHAGWVRNMAIWWDAKGPPVNTENFRHTKRRRRGTMTFFSADYSGNRVMRLDPVTNVWSSFYTLVGVTGVNIDYSTNTMYVAAWGSHCVHRVNILTAGQTGVMGACGAAGNVQGLAANTRLNLVSAATFVIPPRRLTSVNKRLFIMDDGNCCIVEVDIATLDTTRWAGLCGACANTDGPAIGTGRLFWPVYATGYYLPGTADLILYVTCHSGVGGIRRIYNGMITSVDLIGHAAFSDLHLFDISHHPDTLELVVSFYAGNEIIRIADPGTTATTTASWRTVTVPVPAGHALDPATGDLWVTSGAYNGANVNVMYVVRNYFPTFKFLQTVTPTISHSPSLSLSGTASTSVSLSQSTSASTTPSGSHSGTVSLGVSTSASLSAAASATDTAASPTQSASGEQSATASTTPTGSQSGTVSASTSTSASPSISAGSLTQSVTVSQSASASTTPSGSHSGTVSLSVTPSTSPTTSTSVSVTRGSPTPSVSGSQTQSNSPSPTSSRSASQTRTPTPSSSTSLSKTSSAATESQSPSQSGSSSLSPRSETPSASQTPSQSSSPTPSASSSPSGSQTARSPSLSGSGSLSYVGQVSPADVVSGYIRSACGKCRSGEQTVPLLGDAQNVTQASASCTCNATTERVVVSFDAQFSRESKWTADLPDSCVAQPMTVSLCAPVSYAKRGGVFIANASDGSCLVPNNATGECGCRQKGDFVTSFLVAVPTRTGAHPHAGRLSVCSESQPQPGSTASANATNRQTSDAKNNRRDGDGLRRRAANATTTAAPAANGSSSADFRAFAVSADKRYCNDTSGFACSCAVGNTSLPLEFYFNESSTTPVAGFLVFCTATPSRAALPAPTAPPLPVAPVTPAPTFAPTFAPSSRGAPTTASSSPDQATEDQGRFIVIVGSVVSVAGAFVDPTISLDTSLSAMATSGQCATTRARSLGGRTVLVFFGIGSSRMSKVFAAYAMVGGLVLLHALIFCGATVGLYARAKKAAKKKAAKAAAALVAVAPAANAQEAAAEEEEEEDSGVQVVDGKVVGLFEAASKQVGFPRHSWRVVFILFGGICFESFELLHQGARASVVELVVGSLGVAYIALIFFLLQAAGLFSVSFKGQYILYGRKVGARLPPILRRLFIPSGFWIEEASGVHRVIPPIVSLEPKQATRFVVLHFVKAAACAVVGSYPASTTSECQIMYWLLGAISLTFAAVTAYFRPSRLGIAVVSSVILNVIVALLAFSAAHFSAHPYTPPTYTFFTAVSFVLLLTRTGTDLAEKNVLQKRALGALGLDATGAKRKPRKEGDDEDGGSDVGDEDEDPTDVAMFASDMEAPVGAGPNDKLGDGNGADVARASFAVVSQQPAVAFESADNDDLRCSTAPHRGVVDPVQDLLPAVLSQSTNDRKRESKPGSPTSVASPLNPLFAGSRHGSVILSDSAVAVDFSPFGSQVASPTSAAVATYDLEVVSDCGDSENASR